MNGKICIILCVHVCEIGQNSSEEHEIDSFYGYLAHVELKFYCIPIVLDSNFIFSRIKLITRL